MFANYANNMRNANDSPLAHLRLRCEVLDEQGNPKVMKSLQLPILPFDDHIEQKFGLQLSNAQINIEEINNICNYESLVEELLSDSEDEDDNDVLYLVDGPREADADTAIDSQDFDAMSDGSADIPEEGSLDGLACLDYSDSEMSLSASRDSFHGRDSMLI